MRYVVFGVGNEVRLYYSNEFIEKIDFFIDNDEDKQGKLFLGKKIYAPEYIKNIKCFVIISSIYEYGSMKKQLLSYGLREKKDFTWGPNFYGNNEITSTYGYKKWEDYDSTINFLYGNWDYRVKKVSECIDESINSVLDLGAGAMSLKNFLNSKVIYYPVDYCKRAEETIVCNFEKYEFPDINVDCIAASGILEYISDMEWFIGEICKRCETAVISYIPIEKHQNFAIRQHEGWKNNYSIIELCILFQKNGFIPIQEKICIGNDLIIQFKKVENVI